MSLTKSILTTDFEREYGTLMAGSVIESLGGLAVAVPGWCGKCGAGVPRTQVREVGDGNINYVWAVTGPSGSLVLKQGPPYVRVASSWALSQVFLSPPVR